MRPGVFAEVRLDTRRGGKKAKRSRGKPQLREFERVRWYAKALELAEEGDQAALAALIALDGGLRSSEITGRKVRDIDRNGAAIVVENGKTESSDRTQHLSPDVAELLRRYIAGRPADEPLFPEVARLSDGKAWLLRAVTAICRLAGVPRVTPHGLRGTSATSTDRPAAGVGATWSRRLGGHPAALHQSGGLRGGRANPGSRDRQPSASLTSSEGTKSLSQACPKACPKR